MKLPEKIKGWHRIRDGKICLLWDKYEMSTEQIAERVDLTQRRIEQILRANHFFVTIDKEWEKKKRIHLLKSWLKNQPGSKKDAADLLEQLRKETEGDLGVIGGTQIHIHPDKILIFKDIKNGDGSEGTSGVYAGEGADGNRVNGKI